MIRALIADDEALSRRALQQMLERHADVTIVAECGDGAAAAVAIEALEPDVAFLDIRMPLDSGLDVANAAVGSNTLIVFVTAFGEFALPAFDAGAADYLTKPLTEARFDQTLDRVRARVHLGRDARLSVTRAADSYVPHLVTRVGMTDVVIPLETIDYIQADDVYAAVVSRARRHLVRTPLDELERTLDPAVFARIHRSYIVRLDRVIALRRHHGGGGEVVVEGGMVLPVSRRRRARVAEAITARTARTAKRTS